MLNPDFTLFLASQSPRRRALLKELGIPVTIIQPPDIDEEAYPNHLKGGEIPLYLAKSKSEAIKIDLPDNGVLVTADTIVWLEDEVVGKPVDNEDAILMLKKLSGKKHQVFTGVCLKNREIEHSFYDTTDVYFKTLTNEEIDYYVNKFNPTDKAGSYGVQEWIGIIGVERIDGSYFNVMGLPTHRLYKELQLIINKTISK